MSQRKGHDLSRYCDLRRHVAQAMRWDYAADCFCTDTEQPNYRADDEIFQYILDAVNAKLEADGLSAYDYDAAVAQSLILLQLMETMQDDEES